MTASAASHPQNVIRLRDVHVAFEAGEPVLEGFDFAARSGETVIILGESGSGKSTLLSLVLGLIHPSQGRVEVFGQRVSQRRERELYALRQHIGMVFQHSALFDSETVKTNVGFRMLQDPDRSRDDFDRECKEKLEFVGLAGFEDRMPGELSGGQRKRVAIARALVGDPALMLYDEPTTGLDPITARRILDVIKRVKSELGTTSLVVTHELHYAYAVADRVALIRRGEIIFDGTADEFRSSDDPYITDFRSMEAA